MDFIFIAKNIHFLIAILKTGASLCPRYE